MGAANYKILKYLTDNPKGYETLSLGNVQIFTDLEVENGVDSGIWGYEMVAEKASGTDIAISPGVSFNSATGEIVHDTWH